MGPPGPLNPFQGMALVKPHQGAHEGVLVMGTLHNKDLMDGGTQKMCCLSSLFNEALGTPPGAKAPPKEEMGWQGDCTQQHVNPQLSCEKKVLSQL